MRKSAVVYALAVIILVLGGFSLQSFASVTTSDSKIKTCDSGQTIKPARKDSSIEVAAKRIYIGDCRCGGTQPPPVPGL
ncbi:MAG: hypothetical protein AAF462_02100 [Thermodesulfobacteriota bacterium]